MPALFLLFNHTLTAGQAFDARVSLGIERLVLAPPDILAIWSSVPPEAAELAAHLRPVFAWLDEEVADGDCVLVQGDFGAVYLVVNFALARRCIPVYSTTEREAVEEHQPDGSVWLTHRFRHRRFRRYGR
jgi:hypothetical protein